MARSRRASASPDRKPVVAGKKILGEFVIINEQESMHEGFRVIRGGRAATPGAEGASSPFPAHFEDALIPHLNRLFDFALKLAAGNRGMAEDLFQEACLRAFRSYGSLRSPEKFESWLFRILVNTHINEFHKRNRKPPTVDVELSEALLESACPARATPESQLLERLLDSEIQHALNALPVEFRAVVWLADVEELSYTEISEIVQCPPGTVASRLFRAHSLLREYLRDLAQRRGLLRE